MCIIIVVAKIIDNIVSNLLHHCVLSWINLKSATIYKACSLCFCISLLWHKVRSKLIDKFINKIWISCSWCSGKFNPFKSCIDIIGNRFIIFFLGNLSGISDNMGKILAVYIFSDGIFRDIHTLQCIHIFCNICYGFITNILGNGCGNVFLIAVFCNGTTQYHNPV